MKDKRRNLIFCLVSLALCGALLFLPSVQGLSRNAAPREKVKVLAVDNSTLLKIGVVYADTQKCHVEILTGAHKGEQADASNYMNSALDKDKLFAPGDIALAMVNAPSGGNLTVTMIDHYRLDSTGLLFGLFGLLLIVFAGISGFGALISLILSVVIVWKGLVPLMLMGWPPIPVTLTVVTFLTAMIDFLVAGFTCRALIALIGSLLGTGVTCVLAVAFGNLLKVDGGSLPYVVPLIAQGGMKINLKELFFSMVFLANSGALMDLSMDIASASEEVHLHNPTIARGKLLKSGLSVGRSVIGTMTTTLMLAYSGSYLSLMMYFAGQGTPVIDILNLKYVASEILTTLVGSFGLVTVAPFTAIVAAFVLIPARKRAPIIEDAPPASEKAAG
jgi:uncharacterized membrane protein